jgi:hypothetical protein
VRDAGSSARRAAGRLALAVPLTLAGAAAARPLVLDATRARPVRLPPPVTDGVKARKKASFLMGCELASLFYILGH